MRTFVPPCLLLLVAGVALGGGAEGVGAAAGIGTAPAAAPGGGDAWKEFRVKDHHFRALFPGEAKLIDSKQDKTADVKVYGLVEKDGNAYMVIVSDVAGGKFESEKTTDQLLDNIRNKAVKEGAKLEKETKIVLGGTLPGRDLLLTLKAGPHVRVRYWAVNGRVYQAMAYGSKEWVGGPDTEKFLDSFMLTQ